MQPTDLKKAMPRQKNNVKKEKKGGGSKRKSFAFTYFKNKYAHMKIGIPFRQNVYSLKCVF